jgi:hypothetical protein
MPFPIAHPAAVLPLRRCCPQWLNFPALVIGSLVPDLGYCGEQYHLAEFSHRFVAGAFGFDLPVGFLIWLVFYGIRRPVIGLLPRRDRDPFLRQCHRPTGFPWMIALSLLIGTWTHLSLDSITHADGWVVEHVPFFWSAVPWVGNGQWRVFGVLYGACTFCGTAWLAITYLRWLDAERGPLRFGRTAQWGCALVLALGILGMAEAFHQWQAKLGLFRIGALTGLWLLAFWFTTEMGYGKPKD